MIDIHPIIENYVLANNVPLENITLLLLFPLIATLVAFFRQVVGVKAFGIYTPSLIIFAFLIIGSIYGIAVYVGTILIGMISRIMLKKLRILYLSRVAITLSIISFSFIGILILGAYTNRTGFATMPIIPLLIMIVITEKFIATQIEKDTRTAAIMAIQTLVISLIVYAIVGLPFIISTILLYPWIPLLTIPINIILGRWTGLRLSEYYRFRSILKKQ